MGRSILSFVHHHVFVEDMNDGKLTYAKFGKLGLNNCEFFTKQHIAKG